MGSGWLDDKREKKPNKWFSWSWIAWLTAFVILETWAILRPESGDTLTESVKYVMYHYWWAWAAVGCLLVWLFYHFMIEP